ncbi:hypothetical protein ASD15_21945 [Massilia sp. Root351]|jgi:hypothetical protein|uniref:head-tail connector protein n=1 Tax=Massilia sp. Root351 TaxID=1736522 RepID=UPI00070C3056|nr:head-tail connector protein [Massilia sp. Root351]KQV78478.1 hypothetical protein ASD15_21945 [Massilia sp. Root351]
MPLISMDLALAHLRAESGDEDILIRLYADAAVQAVCDYTERQFYPDQAQLDAAMLAGTAGDAPKVATASVLAAALLMLGHLYANREDTVVGVSVAELPMGAKSLLSSYRVGMGA